MQALVETIRFGINIVYQMKINYAVDYYSSLMGCHLVQ